MESPRNRNARPLELCFGAFGRDLSVESFVICAVVIYHEVLSDPVQVANLSITQPLVYARSPPICWDIGGTLMNAHCPITPLASPCPETIKPGLEWCTPPIGLDKPASSCPIVCIP